MLELGILRDGDGRQLDDVAEKLLELYPSGDRSLDRKLERLLAHLHPEGTIEAMVAVLEASEDRHESVHTMYALRTIDEGWDEALGRRAVGWFDEGFTLRGAASMSGYVEVLWLDLLERIPESERRLAEARREEREAAERARLAELLEPREGDEEENPTPLGQMSIDELAEYLEYDVMAYERYSPEKGEAVFRRARCADCHVFGDIGRGGGPDLSTVVKRFRRREILEAIAYPSRVVSDQYSAYDVELENGEFLSGFVADESDERLVLIDARGTRHAVDKTTIRERRTSEVSLMPEGLLDAMTLRDLVDLMRFLDEGAEATAGP